MSLRRTISQSDKNAIQRKRKYGRSEETAAMTSLRLEAAKAVKQRLGIKNIAANNVKFNVGPFPKQKTIYVWKVVDNINGGLTSEEQSVVERTIYCDRENRKFARWEDSDRRILAGLIKKGALAPYYYNKSSDAVQDTPTAWEPQSSDTEADPDIDSSSDDGGDDDNANISQLSTRARKRQRNLSVEITSESDSTSSVPPNVTLPQATSPLAVKEALSAMDISMDSAQEREVLIETSIITPTVTTPKSEKNSDSETPSINKEAPRTMSLNAQGILDFVTSRLDIPSPLLSKFTPAPVAASLANTDNSNSDHGSTEDDSEGEVDFYKEHCQKGIQDLARCMQGFINGATVGYLESPRLKKDNRGLKRDNQRLKKEIAKLEKEQGTKIGVLRGQIESLQANFEIQVRSKSLLENKITVSKDQSEVLEAQLGESKAKTRQLEDSLRVSKQAESTTKRELDALKECFQREKSDLVKVREGLEIDIKVYQTEAGYLKEQYDSLLEANRKLKETAESQIANEQCLQQNIQKLQEERDAALRDRQGMINRMNQARASLLVEGI